MSREFLEGQISQVLAEHFVGSSPEAIKQASRSVVRLLHSNDALPSLHQQVLDRCADTFRECCELTAEFSHSEIAAQLVASEATVTRLRLENLLLREGTAVVLEERERLKQALRMPSVDVAPIDPYFEPDYDGIASPPEANV